MPNTIFNIKPATRREAIEAAVEATWRHLSAPRKACISADPIRGGFTVLVTGPHGVEHSVSFVMDEEPGVITAYLRSVLAD